MNNAWFAEMGLIPLALPVARNLVVPQEARHVVRERGGNFPCSIRGLEFAPDCKRFLKNE